MFRNDKSSNHSRKGNHHRARPHHGTGAHCQPVPRRRCDLRWIGQAPQRAQRPPTLARRCGAAAGWFTYHRQKWGFRVVYIVVDGCFMLVFMVVLMLMFMVVLMVYGWFLVDCLCWVVPWQSASSPAVIDCWSNSGWCWKCFVISWCWEWLMVDERFSSGVNKQQ